MSTWSTRVNATWSIVEWSTIAVHLVSPNHNLVTQMAFIGCHVWGQRRDLEDITFHFYIWIYNQVHAPKHPFIGLFFWTDNWTPRNPRLISSTENNFLKGTNEIWQDRDATLVLLHSVIPQTQTLVSTLWVHNFTLSIDKLVRFWTFSGLRP